MNIQKKVCFIDEMDYANVMTQWSTIINKYSKKYTSKVICWKKHPMNYDLQHDFDTDINKNINVINNTINWINESEYIIVGDTFFNNFGFSIDVQKVITKILKVIFPQKSININYIEKKIILWHPGTIYRNNHNKFTYINCLKVITAPDLYRLSTFKNTFTYYPMMSNSDSIDITKIMNNKINENKIIISHCPSNPHVKRTDIIDKIVQRVIKGNDRFKYIKFSKVSNKTVMKLKERSLIYIDWFSPKNGYGSFGVSSFEALSVGNINLCSIFNITENTKIQASKKLGNNNSLPIIDIGNTEEQFYNVLKNVCDKSNEELIKLGIDGYNWMINTNSDLNFYKKFESEILTT